MKKSTFIIPLFFITFSSCSKQKPSEQIIGMWDLKEMQSKSNPSQEVKDTYIYFKENGECESSSATGGALGNCNLSYYINDEKETFGLILKTKNSNEKIANINGKIIFIDKDKMKVEGTINTVGNPEKDVPIIWVFVKR